jgi:hypothetical protein
MISSQPGYPIHCTVGGKCIYSSRNTNRHLKPSTDIETEYHQNNHEIYGDSHTDYGRFSDLGTPIFTLQFKPNEDHEPYNINSHDETPVISEDIFDSLFESVAFSNTKTEKVVKKKETKEKKNSSKTKKKSKEKKNSSKTKTKSKEKKNSSKKQ